MRVFWGGLIVLGLAGCSNTDRMMPMRVGQAATYEITVPPQKIYETVRISKRTAVGGTTGFEFSGPHGLSRLAWKNGELIASQLGDTTFIPAIPIYTPVKDAVWKGSVTTLGRTESASAKIKLDEKRSDITLIEREELALACTVELTLSEKTRVEIKSWFQPGRGLVLQETRVDDRLKLRVAKIDDE